MGLQGPSSANITPELAKMKNEGHLEDVPLWRWDPKGIFSVKSTYTHFDGGGGGGGDRD